MDNQVGKFGKRKTVDERLYKSTRIGTEEFNDLPFF